jgi:pre-mRNA-splicing factor SYF1
LQTSCHELNKILFFKTIDVFNEAIQSVDYKQANGKYHILWIEFAKHYEKHFKYSEAEKVFTNSVKTEYKNIDELGNLYCEWAEMKLRNK